MGRIARISVAVIIVLSLVAGLTPGGKTSSPADAAEASVEPKAVPLIDSPPADKTPPELPPGTEGAVGVAQEDGSSKLSVTTPDGKEYPAPSVVRELEAERQPDRRIYEMSDGNRKVTIYGQARWFKDSAGQWKDIDTSLSAIPENPTRLRSGANSFTAEFAETLATDAAAMTLKTQAGDVQFQPRGAASVSPTAQKIENQTVPNTLVYPEIWPSTEARYFVLPTGVKEELVVASAKAPTSFVYDVKGAVFAPDGSTGGLIGEGSAGRLVIAPPVVRDADGNDVTRASGAKLTPLDEGKALEVSIDPNWLKNLKDNA
ncbi:MAG: hypothetical protein ACRDIA_08965, partial [Actinomycetota bacterium]